MPVILYRHAEARVAKEKGTVAMNQVDRQFKQRRR